MQPYEILADQGNCREVDPNTMYPELEDLDGIAIAKSVCSDCVVVDLCRTEAFRNKERHGVWAGMTEDERRKLGNKIGRVARNGKSRAI